MNDSFQMLHEKTRSSNKLAGQLEREKGEQLLDKDIEYIEKIKTSAKKMQVLIRDLLVFAEVGSLDKEMEEVDLDLLIQEVLQNLEVSIAERDAKISIKTIGRVQGNSLHLQQMFQNLLSNSLKYSNFKKVIKAVYTT